MRLPRPRTVHAQPLRQPGFLRNVDAFDTDEECQRQQQSAIAALEEATTAGSLLWPVEEPLQVDDAWLCVVVWFWCAVLLQSVDTINNPALDLRAASLCLRCLMIIALFLRCVFPYT